MSSYDCMFERLSAASAADKAETPTATTPEWRLRPTPGRDICYYCGTDNGPLSGEYSSRQGHDCYHCGGN